MAAACADGFSNLPDLLAGFFSFNGTSDVATTSDGILTPGFFGFGKPFLCCLDYIILVRFITVLRDIAIWV